MHCAILGIGLGWAALTGNAIAGPTANVPAAIYTDPSTDKDHPARMEVLHIPSGGVMINGVAYVAAGAGPHPTVLLFHGLPGNEKNLDLAQAIRRAGWTVVTFNYRGSWGSPGKYRFRQDLEDGRAAYNFIRDAGEAARLGIDPQHIVLIGHSLGGWAAAHTAAAEGTAFALVTICAADMALLAKAPEADRIKDASENMEALAGVTAKSMADDLLTIADTRLPPLTPRLKDMPYLALTSDDGLGPHTDALVAAIKQAGGTKVSAQHVATDHPWSDKRIALEATIINWLQALKSE